MIGLLSLFLATSAQAADTWIYYSPYLISAADISPLSAALAGAGASVTTTTSSSWPTNWTGYKLVIILLPEARFSVAQSAALEDFVNDGGRLVVSGEWEDGINGYGTYNDTVNALLSDVGTNLFIPPNPIVSGLGCGTINAGGITADQLTSGVSGLYISASQAVSGGTSLATSAGSSVLAYDQPNTAVMAREPYDVVAAADVNLFMTTCAGSSAASKNAGFWANLYIDCPDDDGDGHEDDACGGDDCDDTVRTTFPGSAETCDGVDQDCNGYIDEGVTTRYYDDFDADFYGDPTTFVDECANPGGWTTDGTDCNDRAADVNPGEPEVCDGVDNDCDGDADEGLLTRYYEDADADLYGDPASFVDACSNPGRWATAAGDCDDRAADVYPGATEACDGVDNDCDGTIDEDAGLTFYRDRDGDGYGDPAETTVECSVPVGYATDDTDCNDILASINPGAAEACNSLDDDCDGLVDEGATSVFYLDADGDNHGDPDVTAEACSAPAGYCVTNDDCWDDDANVYPGAAELADGVDGDCDGTVDEGTAWYDDDGDGYAEDGGDCNDRVADVHPGGLESWDGVDQDCDGVIDEGTEAYDDDGDGQSELAGDCNDGDPTAWAGGREVPNNGVDDDCDGAVDAGDFDPDGDGYLASGGDCDESDAAVFPGAAESANGLDDDCDGAIDEGTADVDADGDGTTTTDGDCNDWDAAIHPAAPDDANGVDDDCDGQVDEGTERFDDDGDGLSELAGDCDDADAASYPGAAEADDGKDNDCDGVAEVQGDADGDGVTVDAGDCNDADGWVSPSLSEMCDGIDNDCDELVDEDCEVNEGEKVESSEGFCSTSAGGVTLWPLAAAALLARRRRARP